MKRSKEPEVEAFGIMGPKHTPWTKTFPSTAEMAAWVCLNKASVLGTRVYLGKTPRKESA